MSFCNFNLGYAHVACVLVRPDDKPQCKILIYSETRKIPS